MLIKNMNLNSLHHENNYLFIILTPFIYLRSNTHTAKYYIID